MNKNRFYFCYSKQLHTFLNKVNKVPYVCAARHENTYEKFWLYEKTPQVSELLDAYSKIMSQLKEQKQ